MLKPDYDDQEYGAFFFFNEEGKKVGQFILSKNGYISAVSIHIGHQGKGYGKQMMKECVDLCKQKGYKKLTLGVFRDNIAAVRIYENAGFRFLDNEGVGMECLIA